jgi:hypothetical protein
VLGAAAFFGRCSMSDPSSRASALDTQVRNEWAPELRALFDGTELAAKAGFTASLVTVDAEGCPHTSLLSAGELYAPDSHALLFLLWPTARAARALREQAAQGRARATLAFVYDAAFFQVRLTVDALPDDGELACFDASIETVQAQRVAYAKLTSGIAFELEAPSSDAVLSRWWRQIDRLRLAAQARRPASSTSGD